jgi:hypothetical protein
MDSQGTQKKNKSGVIRRNNEFDIIIFVVYRVAQFSPDHHQPLILLQGYGRFLCKGSSNKVLRRILMREFIALLSVILFSSVGYGVDLEVEITGKGSRATVWQDLSMASSLRDEAISGFGLHSTVHIWRNGRFHPVHSNHFHQSSHVLRDRAMIRGAYRNDFRQA